MRDFKQILEKIRLHLEKKYQSRVFDTQIAQCLGISKEHLSKSKKDNTVPLNAVVNFCAKEGLVINYILFDQDPDSLNLSTQSLISVKYFEHIHTSAGGGAINEENAEYDELYLDQKSISLLGGESNLKHIEAIRVTGDSMEPVIKDGAILFVDRSKNEIRKDKQEIYVLRSRAGIVVKYVDKTIQNEIKLISANELYESEVIAIKDVSIIGKAVGVIESL